MSDSINSYVRIALDTGPLNVEALEETFERLHALGGRFRLDVRLLTGEKRLEYYIGTTQEHRSTLEHALRQVFPEGADFETTDLPPLPAAPKAALQLRGRGERSDDWQTRLRPVTDGERAQFPLATAVETIADTESTVVYQTLLMPHSDWRGDAQLRIEELKRDRDTTAQRLFDFLGDEYEPDPDLEDADPTHRKRVRSIQTAAPKHSFRVYARAIAAGPDSPAILEELANAFRAADGDFYSIDPIVYVDDESIEAIADRIEATEPPDDASLFTRLKRRLPITTNADAEIVADPLTAPNFCLFDGASLTTQGRRALDVTPDEQTNVPRPDTSLLTQYDSGLLLGYPLTSDGATAASAVSLPPSLQSLHAAWFGKTGSGKSTALINAILENHRATDGADILIDPKGDGMPLEYLQAHYAEYGTLENVYYFDCTETLPAISFFDIRDQLADGIDRTTAIEDVTDHYIEMLVGIMGKDRFEQAVRSPDIIRYLVKAMFDPVHGDDAYSHRALQEAATRMRETRDAPPVVDPELQRMLAGVVSNSKRSFDELLQGVANRIEKIPLDDRLGKLFNHVPQPDDPTFDFRDVIDEDAVVLVDTGGLRPESRRVISLVVLSQLWGSLRRRTRQTPDSVPLVNLYLEEAATIASSGLVTELLAQSRAFGLSMTLAMQFPGQLRQADNEAYAELLNNVSTIVTGNVAVDPDLKKRLATADMSPEEVANRLRALRRGQWFVTLPSEFGRSEPRPFLLESAPIPAGHPESDTPLSSAKRTAFEAAFDVVRDRSRLEHGIDLAATQRRAARTESAERDEPTVETSDETVPADSLLPYTKRLPEVLAYDGDRHALRCSSCDSRYDPTREGIERALECCHDLESVDRDDIPVCELNLKLSADERIQSPYTDAQLRFLHAVYAAHQQRFDPDLEFDLLYDSMYRLREYVGIDNEAVDELLEAGLLRKDCQYPHVLYTVTPEGRNAAKIEHREGLAHGDGAGDLNESSFHVAMVAIGERYLEETFLEDPDSAVVEVSPYYDVEGGRLDAAGIDADGDVVVALEAERSNHDTLEAAPEDYDKMAAQDPNAAIWIVESRDGGHDVLGALHEPGNGEPRTEKTYSRSTAPRRCNVDAAGLTRMYTFTYLRDSLLEAATTD
jgi:DNA helicase HerA-like ATPase